MELSQSCKFNSVESALGFFRALSTRGVSVSFRFLQPR
jgi:hypothetical protein